MAFWTEARIFVGVVATVVTSVAELPAEYAAVVGLTAKQAFGARPCFCYTPHHHHHHQQQQQQQRHAMKHFVTNHCSNILTFSASNVVVLSIRDAASKATTIYLVYNHYIFLYSGFFNEYRINAVRTLRELECDVFTQTRSSVHENYL